MSTPTPLILLDGGLGTTLSAPPYSFTFDTSKPLWSSHLLLSPASLSTLLSAQTAFVGAGAEVILTDTYQASFEGFALSGVEDEEEAGRLMRGAVVVAKSSFAGTKGKVALSLGPYGAIMIPGQEYTGLYDELHQTISALADWHLKRLDVFSKLEETQCWQNIDMIAFETIPLLKEVEAAREVMTRLQAHDDVEEKDFWIACVFPGEANTLPDGTSVREVVRKMLGSVVPGTVEGRYRKVPMGIGFNCTKIIKVEGLIAEFEDAVREMVENGEAAEWPSLVVYPDGTNGEVYNTTTKTWEEKEAGTELSWDETLFAIVSRARERGLWKSVFVGGCCKTTPIEIEKLRRRIDGENC